MEQSYALRETINNNFEKVRSRADGLQYLKLISYWVILMNGKLPVLEYECVSPFHPQKLS